MPGVGAGMWEVGAHENVDMVVQGLQSTCARKGQRDGEVTGSDA